ncbi:MAG: hypothetical protein ACRCT8_18295 [Lacipirellulaceae bacterium]
MPFPVVDVARAVAAFTFVVVVHGAALAASGPRPADRVVLVSTRPVGCSTSASRLASGVTAAVYEQGAHEQGAPSCGARWRDAPLGEALATLDPSAPIIVFVHGNQIEACDAPAVGLRVVNRLVSCAGDERPLQVVVFSWASGKVPGLLRDFREKAARTQPVAYQLAWLLGKLPPGAPVGLLGYSYGARVASGAAHLVAGGTLSGVCLNEVERALAQRPMRGVFLAAAEDACWLAPGRYHGHAMQSLETLLVTKNPRDPAMKYYKFVPRKPDPPALGGVGPIGLSAEARPRVATKDVTSSVGRSHDLFDYLAAPGVASASWRRLTFADTAPLQGG